MSKRDKFDITDAELDVMKVLWGSSSEMKVNEIFTALADKGWTLSTVSTLIGRLRDKGTVEYEKRGNVYYYRAAADENEYKMIKTKSFLSKLYGGSVKNMVAALFDNKSLSESDAKEIRDMFRLDDNK